jgi:uncharacterized membrane protein (DUF106 family)
VDWEGLTKLKKKMLKIVSKEVEARDEERVEEPKKYADIQKHFINKKATLIK